MASAARNVRAVLEMSCVAGLMVASLALFPFLCLWLTVKWARQRRR